MCAAIDAELPEQSVLQQSVLPAGLKAADADVQTARATGGETSLLENYSRSRSARASR